MRFARSALEETSAPLETAVKVLRNRRDHLAGDAIVGIVVARKPVARVLVLALRPRLDRLVGIGRVGPHEIQAAPWTRRVVDRDFGFRAGRKRAREVDAQLLVAVIERDALGAGANRAHLDFGGVELKLGHAVEDRGEAMSRGAGDSPLGEIQSDCKPDMLDIGDAVARPFRLDVIGLESPAFAGELAQRGAIASARQARRIRRIRPTGNRGSGACAWL